MILPRTAIYALRTMAVLANLAPGQSIRSRELATDAGVPEHYVSKVMRRLVVAGLVDSQKGHGGGFRLSRAPDKIEFETILRAIDVDLETGRCVFHYRACDAHSPCPLHESWAVLQEALKRWAAGTTLESTRATPLPPV